jgi:excinuclease ABC subunit A
MSSGHVDEPGKSAVKSGQTLRIRGARTHNLKNVDLDIPLGKLVVITGKSGSGKSSLAFDTLFAEGQRQYIETISLDARQYLDQLERPDVDQIEGLAPVVCIDQRSTSANPRSTVATVTEIYDCLRLLFARTGEMSCHLCGFPIHQQSAEQIQTMLLGLPEGTKLVLLAPLVRGRKGQHAEVLEQIRKAGQVRVRVDGAMLELDAVPPLDGRKAHTIEAVVDRIVIRPGVETRLAESLQLAIKQSGGLAVASYVPPASPAGAEFVDRLFSTLYACPNCQTSLEEIEPRTFSFNSPYGACPKCEGLGYRVEFDPELVIPDLGKAVANGAIAAWRTEAAKKKSGRAAKSEETVAPNENEMGIGQQQAAVERFLALQQADMQASLRELPGSVLEKLLRGDGGEFPGLLTLLEQELATATEARRQQELVAYRGQILCAACEGARLRPEALAARIAGKNIAEVGRMSVTEAKEYCAGLAPSHWPLGTDSWEVARPLVEEITARLTFLEKVGLDYLTLERAADTLSGGELQRVRLATGIGSGLAGILYILDEPSIGLHPRDNERLIEALRRLLADENSVLVVEHDEAMMREADWLIDMGPGAGSGGGRVIAAGMVAEVIADPQSLTGQYLCGAMTIPRPVKRRVADPTRAIVIEGVTTNNLKNVTASFPLGLLVGVTGVSGSGKSSLVNDTLAPALVRRLGGVAARPGPHAGLKGAEQIDKVIVIDQTPLGRSSRSSAATYAGAFDEIRKVFAATKEAKQLGFKASRFSFNQPGGRCEECKGHGSKRIEMKFLPDLVVTCPTCHGRRFNDHTLAVKYKGRSIADVLAMPCEEAAGFFENFPMIARIVTSLNDVGLGYLPLGQAATTLSGGESQRIKLATELSRIDTGRTLYFLDEPTTGLHFDDIRMLLCVLQRLVERGNTVIVIEHNLDILKSCDHLIDLGPEGGTRGGYLLAAGTPEEIAAVEGNATGRFLRGTLRASR